MNQREKNNYFLFIIIGYIPLIWKIFQIFCLTPFSNALKILGQLSLMAIIFKIFQETIIQPLYKTFGDAYDNKSFLARKYFKFIFIASLIFTFIIFFITPQIAVISEIPSEILKESIIFLKLSSISFGLNILVQFLYTFNIVAKNTKNIVVYLLVNSFMLLLLNFIICSKYCFGIGVNGVAYSEIIINIFLIFYLYLSLSKEHDNTFVINKKQYLKLASISFAETLVRNVVYYFIILVFLNILNNQDIYYVANDFIWSVMLVPVLAQSTLIKQSLAQNNSQPLKKYFINTLLLCIFIILLVPVAFLLFKYIYQFPNYSLYFYTLIKLVPCYLLFSFDSVVEAYFVATGKLHHILIQTILTNLFVYGIAYVLFLFNVWTITLNAIIILFNLGMIVSSCYTLIVFCVITYNNKKQKFFIQEKNDCL